MKRVLKNTVNTGLEFQVGGSHNNTNFQISFALFPCNL